MKHWKRPAPWQGQHRSALRHAARKPFGVVAALVAGALFWATYHRFVRPSRSGKCSGHWPHSGCSE